MACAFVRPVRPARATPLAFCLLALGWSTTTPLAADAQMSMPGLVMETKDEIAPEQLPPPERLSGVGNVHMQIAASPEAQIWFDQGLNLLHDFWDYESARAFEQGVRVDPQCAMCYWGLYEAESYYHSTAKGYAKQSLERAESLAGDANEHDRLIILATAAADAAAADPGSASTPSDAQGLWRTLVQQYPHDLEARILLAAAVDQNQARALLESVLKDDPQNSAANHLYIHMLEASDHPEQALHSAEILADLAPGSGHMVHMPGHIYFRLGEYAKAEAAFEASTEVDEKYMREQHVSVDDDWNYVHNLMYAVANLLEEGKLAEATKMSAKLSGARGELDSTLYPFSPRDAISRLNPELPVALRTADWATVLKLSQSSAPPAAQPNLVFLARQLSEFALGMRAAAAGRLAEGEAHSARFDAALWRRSGQLKASQAMSPAMPDPVQGAPREMRKNPVRSDAYLGPLLNMLSVMSLELRGSLLADEKQVDQAEAVFAQAEREEKSLGYREPPLYIRPVGESEAAAWMAVGGYVKAETAYRQALAERPRSGFSLYGLARCSEDLGDAARAVERYNEFLDAWKNADASLPELRHARLYVERHQGQSAAGARS